MVAQPEVQYIVDEQGDAVSVIIPIELWRELLSERETAYLLQSTTMRERLLQAKARQGGISLEDVSWNLVHNILICRTTSICLCMTRLPN